MSPLNGIRLCGWRRRMTVQHRRHDKNRKGKNQPWKFEPWNWSFVMCRLHMWPFEQRCKRIGIEIIRQHNIYFSSFNGIICWLWSVARALVYPQTTFFCFVFNSSNKLWSIRCRKSDTKQSNQKNGQGKTYMKIVSGRTRQMKNQWKKDQKPIYLGWRRCVDTNTQSELCSMTAIDCAEWRHGSVRSQRNDFNKRIFSLCTTT